MTGPLLHYLGDGRCEVTFRWYAEAEVVVDVHLTGHVGETVHDATPLEHLGDGEHAVTVHLPEDACLSYGFRVSPASGHAVVPLNELVDHLVADPHNADRIHGAFGSLGATSVLTLRSARWHPSWPPVEERAAPAPPAALPEPLPAGPRALRWLPGTGGSVVVLLDGGIWARDDFGFTRAWHRHTGDRGAERPALVFVDTADREVLADRARMRELLLHDVLPHLPTSPGEVVVAGQSYGGLAAAGLLVDLPDVVEAAVVQSGSFWFGAERPDDPGSAGVGTVVHDLARRAPGRRQRVVVQAGSSEGSMLTLSERFAEVSAEAGVLTSLEVFSGGHDYAWYRHGLLLALDRLGLPGPRGAT